MLDEGGGHLHKALIAGDEEGLPGDVYPIGDGDVAELSLRARLVQAAVNLLLRLILLNVVEDALHLPD